MEGIGDASASVRHDFKSQLDALENDTRRDEVVWNLTSSPPLDVNDFDQEDRDRVHPTYLVTTHGATPSS